MKIIALTILTAAFVCGVSAQSVVITPKKATYTRPKPMTEYKKSFTVNYPKVRASTAALSRKIESNISYLKVLGLNIREEINEVQWLEEADYEVSYNARGLLCITLFISGSGAYPSGTSKTVVVDLKTGDRVTPSIAFVQHSSIAKLVKEKQKAEIETSIAEIRKDPNANDEDPANLFENIDFTIKDLDEFSVDDSGVTFIYDYGFPHVIKALQPDGTFRFGWKEIKRFINLGGPFAQFIVK